MKKSLVVWAGLLMLLVFGCNAPEAPKFGVVDIAKVINNAKASQKANAEIEALVKAKQADLNKKTEALKNLEKSIKEPGAKGKTEEYNRTLAEYQRMARTAESELKNKAAELRKTVLEQVKKFIGEVGKDEKLAMIFVTEMVPFYQAATDVTDKVIKKYDEAGDAEVKAAPPAPPAAK